MTNLLNKYRNNMYLLSGFKSAMNIACRALAQDSGEGFVTPDPNIEPKADPVLTTDDTLQDRVLSEIVNRIADMTSQSSNDQDGTKENSIKEFTDVPKLIKQRSFQRIRSLEKISDKAANKSIIGNYSYKRYFKSLNEVNMMLTDAIHLLKDESNQSNMFTDRRNGNEIVNILKGTNALIQNLAQWNSILEKVAADRLIWIRSTDFDKIGSKPRVVKSSDVFTVDGITSYRFVDGIPTEIKED